MPGYGKPLKPQRRLGGLPGFSKSAVLPNVIIKEEDRLPLRRWQEKNGLPIHVWHVFYDLAFGIALEDIEQLLARGLIQPTEQIFQAPGGATTTKRIYKVYYHYAYPLGHSVSEPTLQAASIVDKNGHILPYVRFSGGKLQLEDEALEVLHELNQEVH